MGTVKYRSMMMSNRSIDITFRSKYALTMARVPFTLRIETEERAALENLSKIEGRPVNQLLNEAIKSFLGRRGPKERGLAVNLAQLRAYRKRDPKFQRAIAAFVESEASFDDPVEGQVVSGELKAIGPTQSKIREMLGA